MFTYMNFHIRLSPKALEFAFSRPPSTERVEGRWHLNLIFNIAPRGGPCTSADAVNGPLVSVQSSAPDFSFDFPPVIRDGGKPDF